MNDHLRKLATDGVSDVVVIPIGFISDHMEVLYDLDDEAAATSRENVRSEPCGLNNGCESIVTSVAKRPPSSPH